MSIEFYESSRMFMLRAADMLYAMKIVDEGYLCHAYFGKNVPDTDLTYLLRLDESPFVPSVNNRDRACFLDSAPFEYPCFGIGDYRESAFHILDANGMSACDLRYASHKIMAGKPKLAGLPHCFASENEAQTLEILLRDVRGEFEVALLYSVFEGYPLVVRSARIKNLGGQFAIRRAMSLCLELDRCDLDMLSLYGSWGRERTLQRVPLHHGKQSVDSVRGESSHQYNPFIALCEKTAGEENGEAYGFSFIYSGNFSAVCELSQYNSTRVIMGINPVDFSWVLDKDEEFTVPESVLVYSSGGLGKMSRCYHDFYREHLIRSKYKYSSRPVLVNNWEATYFDFDDEKLLDIAREASALGIEMLVMDDGWFGHRNSDNSSLGDWFVNEKKLKGGLKKLVDGVNALGMKFGIWFEPEMVSPNSELFKAHPDWAIRVPDMPMTLCREQYVLDMSRCEVRDYVYSRLKAVLDSANIEYVKWDMNRQLTEVGSAALPAERQRELWHRYVLGVYELMERLINDYPSLLLENCSGGGARFDPAMLYYSPQIWCSDNTDAIERLRIQFGTSLCYPPSSMGAHVSVCPNHITGRSVPFETRGIAAMNGTFGYELDVTRLSETDKLLVREQIAEYKKYCGLVLRGDLFRLGNVIDDPSFDAWMFVSKDKSEAVFSYMEINLRVNARSRRLKLNGLDADALYSVHGDDFENFTASGAALMNCGLLMRGLHGDFVSKRLHITKI